MFQQSVEERDLSKKESTQNFSIFEVVQFDYFTPFPNLKNL